MEKLKEIRKHLIAFATLTMIILLSFPLQAQEKIKWMSFEEAVAKAEKKPKSIFIDMYTDWCGWCKKMDASTFVDPVIVKLMNDHFYAVKFDAEQKDTVHFMDTDFVNPNPDGRRSTHQLAAALLKGKMSYPSFVFLSAKTEWLTVVNGYRKPPEFEQVLTYFGATPYETVTWEEFMETFESNLPPSTEQ